MKKVTIQKNNDTKIEIIESSEFTTEKEANKFKKEMIKKYNLIKHAGHVVNYSDAIELYTTY